LSKLLLHTCCAPCTTYVYQWLTEQKIETRGYFYNPNIRPQEEYERRLLTMEYYSTVVGLKVIYPKEPANEIRGSLLETETFSLRFPIVPGDCQTCYRLRLQKTANFAKQQGFTDFSTTLLISPYQDHELLKNLGETIALETGVNFFYHDWRPEFRTGQNMAREMKLYRQKYCGCGVKRKGTYVQAA